MVVSRTPVTCPDACGSTNGARSPDVAKYGSTSTPPAPGGLVASAASIASTPRPSVRSIQSIDAVPTIAGIARSHRPGSPVATENPAGSPSVASRSTWTMQPSVVPTISSASPTSRTPAPRAQAGKSKGPELIGVPAGSPSRAAPESVSGACGTGR